MKNLKFSLALKSISYILMPVLFLNIIINLFSIVYYDEYKNDIDGKITYFQTQRFANNYFRTINAVVNDYYEQYDYDKNTITITLEDELKNKTEAEGFEHSSVVSYEEENGINYIYNKNRRYDYLIIDKTGKAFTNITKLFQLIL